MWERQIRIQPLGRGRNMKVFDPANGENGRLSSSGPLSWYLTQRLLSGLKYVATINGYVMLA